MKTTKFTCLALLILTLLVARGEDFRTNTNINPALLYYQAFLMAPELSQADRDYLFTNNWQGQKLPERFGELVARYDNEFKLVRQAAHATVPCDWGIDMSPGPSTLLPHLAPAKKVAQTAQLRAMWDLQHGNQFGARDDLLAAFVLARNASRDGTLIATLVQNANEAIIYATVAGNFGEFSPETLKQLVAGFDAAPLPGTIAAVIMTEKFFFHDWVVDKILELQKENANNDAKVMAGFHKLITDLEVTEWGKVPERKRGEIWEEITKAAGGTSAGVLRLLHDVESLYQRDANIMALPYLEYESQVEPFMAEIWKSSNPCVSPLRSYDRVRAREFRIQAEGAMVRTAVEYKLHGESGLKSMTDPFGNGPFAFQRFVFDGVDRGFELKSAYTGNGYPCALIFVEKEGPPFYIEGGPQRIGKAVQP